MAVKTAISHAQMRELLGIQGDFRMEGISRGSVQTNYFLQTKAGKFVFRLYENRSAQSVAFEMETLRELCKKGFVCPEPVGEIGEYVGKPFALFRFLEGSHAREWTDARRISAAKAAAKMALALQGFVPENSAARWNYTPLLCEALARELAQEHGKPGKLAWYLDELRALQLPEGLPMGVCHADWDISNLFYEGDEVSALLDFDDANYTYAAYDLAAQMEVFRPAFRHNTWRAFSKDTPIVELSQARRIAAAYESVRPLSQIERRHMFDLVKMTILIDCLWFFARDDGDFFEKRKIDALNRMGRERFAEILFG